jgi:hypothetical protein
MTGGQSEFPAPALMALGHDHILLLLESSAAVGIHG